MIGHSEVQVEGCLDMGPVSPEFERVNVRLRADLPGVSEAEFLKLAIEAKNGCPISRLLKIDVTMDASLDVGPP